MNKGLKTVIAGLVGAAIFYVIITLFYTHGKVPINSPYATRQTTPPSLLFVVNANSGILKKSGKNYSLILQNPDKTVVWFTDRPFRKTGTLKLNSFIQSWKKAFQSGSPNVALVHANLMANYNRKETPVTLDLKNPVMSRSGNVTFTAIPLGKKKVKTGRIHRVSLFIDNAAFQGGYRRQPNSFFGGTSLA